MSGMDTPLEPEHPRTDGYHRGMKTLGDSPGFYSMLNLLAASVVLRETFLLLQSVNVMAADLRASVRRAISGFMPLASKPT